MKKIGIKVTNNLDGDLTQCETIILKNSSSHDFSHIGKKEPIFQKYFMMAKTKYTSLETMTPKKKIQHFEFNTHCLTQERDMSQRVVLRQRKLIHSMEQLIGIYRRKINVMIDNGVGVPERWAQTGTEDQPFILEEVWE